MRTKPCTSGGRWNRSTTAVLGISHFLFLRRPKEAKFKEKKNAPAVTLCWICCAINLPVGFETIFGVKWTRAASLLSGRNRPVAPTGMRLFPSVCIVLNSSAHQKCNLYEPGKLGLVGYCCSILCFAHAFLVGGNPFQHGPAVTLQISVSVSCFVRSISRVRSLVLPTPPLLLFVDVFVHFLLCMCLFSG